MAKQKPPDSVGRTTGFPYHILWEEFGPEWEKLSEGRDDREELEIVARWMSENAKHPPNVTQQAIDELLFNSGLTEAGQSFLGSKLYVLAANYLLPALRREFGHSTTVVREQLERIARQAVEFKEGVEALNGMARATLGHAGCRVFTPDEDVRMLDELLSLLDELSSLASMVAAEIPVARRGSSVNVLRERFVRDSAELIKSQFGPITMLQSDSEGRNYRPKSEAAQVLSAYVKLVDPAISARAIFRILKKYDLLEPRQTGSRWKGAAGGAAKPVS